MFRLNGSVVEHFSCKEKVLGPIPSLGIFILFLWIFQEKIGILKKLKFVFIIA